MDRVVGCQVTESVVTTISRDKLPRRLILQATQSITFTIQPGARAVLRATWAMASRAVMHLHSFTTRAVKSRRNYSEQQFRSITSCNTTSAVNCGTYASRQIRTLTAARIAAACSFL